jgi:hypothetical protein
MLILFPKVILVRVYMLLDGKARRKCCCAAERMRAVDQEALMCDDVIVKKAGPVGSPVALIIPRVTVRRRSARTRDNGR